LANKKKKLSPIDSLNAELTNFARIYQTRNRNERLAYGLSVSQTNALFMLVEQGESTVGPLAGKLALSLSALTKIVDELESQSLVRRVSDTDDRRATRLLVTAKGKRTYADIRCRFVTHLVSQLSDQSNSELEQMAITLRKISKVISNWQSSIREEG
jgi:DNA-binding MarR family transcriptional regulator